MRQSKPDQFLPFEVKGTVFLNLSVHWGSTICSFCPTDNVGSSLVLVGAAHPSLSTVVLEFTVLLRWQTFLWWCSNTAAADCSHCSQTFPLSTIATDTHGLRGLDCQCYQEGTKSPRKDWFNMRLF